MCDVRRLACRAVTIVVSVGVALAGCDSFFPASRYGPDGAGRRRRDTAVARDAPVAHDADGSGADGLSADGRLADGGRRADGLPADGAGAPDSRPPDAVVVDSTPPDRGLPPDTARPCAGLTCPLGCNVALSRCYRVKPSNFDPKSFHDKVTAALSVSTSAPVVFNTTTGAVQRGTTVIRAAGSSGTVSGGIYWGIVKQSRGPDLSVFGVKSLSVSASRLLRVIGTRSFALYATGDVVVSGALLAAAGGLEPGPGGFAGGRRSGDDGVSCGNGEGRGGKTSSSVASGGGGAGYFSHGGAAGNTPGALGGRPGAPVGTVTLTPLVGGCGGGAGAGSSGGRGGGGGGAVQLVANGRLVVTGAIGLPGKGGAGAGGVGGGGGGGAGGALLLEAPTVGIFGLITANGGGGGGGGSAGTSGGDGPTTVKAASGGTAGTTGGAGGVGGVGGGKEAGGNGKDHFLYSGGGGGATGRIRINTPNLTLGSSNASPTPSRGTTLSKW